MKKFLLLAAAALFGLSGTHATEATKHIVYESTITPVSQLQNGHIYLIYDASKITAGGDTNRRAFRYVEPGSNKIFGTNESKDAADLLYDKFAWQAIQDGSAWKFRHVGSDKYIQAAPSEVKHMTVVDADQAGTYTLEDYQTNHGAFRVKSTVKNADQTNYQYWDGLADATDAPREMCTWNPTTFNASHWYQFFEVTDDMVRTTYNASVKLTYPDGTTCYSGTIEGVTPNEEFTADLPFYIKNQLTFTTEQFESGEDIALEFAEGFTPFKLFSVRLKRWGITNATGMITTTGDTPDQAEWYLEESAGENGTFKIYSVANDTYFGEIPDAADPTPKATAEDAQVYRIDQHANGADRVYNTTGATNVSWNIRDKNGNQNVAGWTGTDKGSWWFMVYDEAVFAANRELYFAGITGEVEQNHMPECMTTIWGSDKAGGKLGEVYELWHRIGGLSNKSHKDMEEAKAALESAMSMCQNFRLGRDNIEQIIYDLTAAIEFAEEVSAGISDNQVTWSQIKLKGDLLAGFVPAEEAEAWQDVITNTVLPVTDEDIANLTAAHNRLSTHIGGVSINFRPFLAGKDHMYICADNAERPTRSTEDRSRAWTLINNNDDAHTGFYIYNEYTGRYMKHSSDAMSYATDQSEASVYNLLIHDPEHPTFLFKTIDSGINENRSYIHSNLQDYLQCWTGTAEASSFYVSIISDHQAATERFNAVNDIAGETAAEAASSIAAKPAGSDLSQYTYAPEVAPLVEAYSHATELVADEEADGNDIRSAADAYRAAYNAYTDAEADLTCTLNMPAPGDLIRLKWVSEDGTTVKYASNENNSNNRLSMLTEDEGVNSANTVWFYDEDNRLVSYSTGLCIGTFSGNGWCTVLHDNSVASPGVLFQEYEPNSGHYLIDVNSGRNIYGANNTIDAGSDISSTNAQIGYQWMLERVYMLPIPVGDSQFTTVHAPVDLNFNHDGETHAVAHTGKIVEATVEYKALAKNNGTYLPANTPALLKVNSRNNGHVYAEVVYPTDAPAEAAPAPYAADDETAETTTVENHFKSDFLAKAKEEGMKYYTLNAAGDAFVPLSESATYVPGFAAHLAVSNDENQQTSYTLKETTLIEEINADSADINKADTVYYDLCGRRVAKPTKGIYVTGNGKKILF